MSEDKLALVYTPQNVDSDSHEVVLRAVRTGFKIESARTSAYCLVVLEQRVPRVMILNDSDPLDKIVERIELIRSESRVPLVVLAFFPEESNESNQLILAGADEYFRKPFSLDLLIARLNSLAKRTYHL